jgi:hypothetical protein
MPPVFDAVALKLRAVGHRRLRRAGNNLKTIYHEDIHWAAMTCMGFEIISDKDMIG